MEVGEDGMVVVVSTEIRQLFCLRSVDAVEAVFPLS